MFYDRFEELCLLKGVKITRACQEMGLSRSLASKWKNTGTQKPSADVLERMSEYFNMSINEILDAEAKKQPATQMDDELLDNALIDRLVGLTPEELSKVDAFVQGLLASR